MKLPEFHRGELVMVQVPVRPLRLKNNKKCWTHFHDAGKIPTGKDVTTRLYPWSLRPVPFRYDTIKGHTLTMFATRWIGLALTDRLWWSPCVTLDEKPSSPEFLPLSSGSQQIQSMRTGQGSQRQTKQFAEGNASTAADQMWGIQRALPGTQFPDSLQKPLLTHADLHAATPQQYRDQQHLELCPKL